MGTFLDNLLKKMKEAPHVGVPPVTNPKMPTKVERDTAEYEARQKEMPDFHFGTGTQLDSLLERMKSASHPTPTPVNGVQAETWEDVQPANQSFDGLSIWLTPKPKHDYDTIYTVNKEPYTRIHLIHWYFKPRSKLELSNIEKFHFNMLYMSDFDNKFNEIYFNVAVDDLNNETQKAFIKQKIAELTRYGSAKVDVKFIKNSKAEGELPTWKRIFDFVYTRSDKCIIFYSHFKGITKESNISERYWSYLMYQGCLIDGWGWASSTIQNRFTCGALINQACKDVRDYYKNYNMASCRSICNPNRGEHYAGTFYFINAVKLKSYLTTKKVTINQMKTLTGNMTSEFFSLSISNGKLFSYFNENWTDGYNSYPNNRIPKYIDKFNRLKETAISLQAKNRCDYVYPSLDGKKILVYTYLENYAGKEPIVFNKEDGVDYIFITDKEQSNYQTTVIADHSTYKDTFDCNRYYKFNPQIFGDYDYVIYRDVRIDITDVKRLIASTPLSKHGINMSKHHKTHSIGEELIECKNARKINDIQYKYAVTTMSKYKNILTTMPEATVIIYDMHKLNKKLIEQIFKDYLVLGIHRDQICIAERCLTENIPLDDICTMVGHIPFNDTISFPNRYLTNNMYYK